MTSAAPAGKPGFSDLEANILQFLSALARQVLISRILGNWLTTELQEPKKEQSLRGGGQFCSQVAPAKRFRVVSKIRPAVS